MFACIHSREHGWTARVDDPNGRRIVVFHAREYDTSTQHRSSPFIKENVESIEQDVAQARRQRQPPAKKKTLRKVKG